MIPERRAGAADSGNGPSRQFLFRARMDQTLGVLVAGLLMVQMFVTLVDVVGRYIFDTPLPGAYELTELLVGGIIFGALPLVTARNEHVKVDLLDMVVPASLRRVQSTLVNLVSAPVVGGIALAVWYKAGQVAELGHTTEALVVPISPILYFFSIMAALAAVIFILNVFLDLVDSQPDTGA